MEYVKKILNLIHLKSKSGTGKKFSQMFLSTFFSQLLLIVFTPILTRIYSPEEYGVYALFLTISLIMSGVFSGKYELALVVALEDEKASLLQIICLIQISFLFIFILIVGIINFPIFKSFQFFENSKWIFFLPVGILLTSSYEILHYYLISIDSFKNLSIFKLLNSILLASVQIVFGVFFKNKNLLIIGYLTAYILSVLIFTIKVSNFSKYKLLSINSLKKIAIKYIEYPKHMVVSGLINRISNNATVIILALFYSNQLIGNFSTSKRLVFIPITLIVSNISDIFFKIMSEYKNNILELELKIKKLTKIMIIIGVVFTLFMSLIFSPFVPLILGEKWILSGELVRILSITIVFQFGFIPLSRVFQILQAQNKYQLWEWLRLFIVHIPLIFFSKFSNIQITTLVYSISLSISYLILWRMSSDEIKRKKNQFLRHQ